MSLHYPIKGPGRGRTGRRLSVGLPSGCPRELLRGCRSRFAAPPLCRRCYHFGSRHDGTGFAAEADLLGHRRTPLRIGRRGDWVIRWQFPAVAVIGHFEIMGDPKMTAENPGAILALEENDVIRLHRASNRNRRHQRLFHQWRMPETAERSMHLGNQSHELVGPDLVMPHVAADDARDPIRIDLRRRILFCHVSALLLVLAVGVAAIETINYYVMDVISPTLFLGSSAITATVLS